MPTQRRILYTLPNFMTAGSGGAMLNIIERLDRELWSPAVCVLKKGGEMEERIARLKLPYFEIPFALKAKPYTTLLLRCWKVSRVLRGERFSLWHSFHYSSDYTEPIIARMAGAKAWVFTKKNMGWADQAWKIRSMLATRIAAQNSHMVRDFFDTSQFRRKVTLLPRGVDTTRFKPGVAPSLGIRAKLGLPPGAVVATVVAQLVPVKGHPTLLESMARVRDLHLWVAGSPMDVQYSERLRKMSAELGLEDRVHFLGPIRQVPNLLAESDIFVLPTWAKWRMEGCPVALLEGMACGCACVATSIPGSSDLLEDGKSGLVVPPEDVPALAAALVRLRDDSGLRVRFGEAARRRVLDHYSIEQEVAAHEQLYREALGIVS